MQNKFRRFHTTSVSYVVGVSLTGALGQLRPKGYETSPLSDKTWDDSSAQAIDRSLIPPPQVLLDAGCQSGRMTVLNLLDVDLSSEYPPILGWVSCKLI